MQWSGKLGANAGLASVEVLVGGGNAGTTLPKPPIAARHRQCGEENPGGRAGEEEVCGEASNPPKKKMLPKKTR